MAKQRKYMLRGQIIRGFNLVAADLGGTSDPYVRIQLGEEVFESNHIKKSLNPVWNAQFKFKNFKLTDELKIWVRDYDTGIWNKDDSLGSASISLEDLPKNFEVTKLINLTGVPHGQILLRLGAEGFGVELTVVFTRKKQIMEIVNQVHSEDDKLMNAIICMETGDVFYGLEEAFKAIQEIRNDKLTRSPKTLILFPGNYLITKPIMINIRDFLMFGIDKVNIISKNPNEYMFHVVDPEQEKKDNLRSEDNSEMDDFCEMYIHNIQFPRNSKCFKMHFGTKLHANNCKLGKVDHRYAGALQETEHDLALDDDVTELMQSS